MVFALRVMVDNCQDRRDPTPSNDCGYPQTEKRRVREEAGEDAKSRFMEEMSGLFDKYLKADSAVEIHNPSEQDELNECESSEGCESEERDERTAALKTLKTAIKAGKPWKDDLWNCIKLHQGYEFTTAGRGRMHTGAVSFTYTLKTSSRTGEETDELIISSKASDGKTVTRSSVELAMKNALEVMEKEGMVRGPKKLGQVFGGSYLYAMLVQWGVIEGKPS